MRLKEFVALGLVWAAIANGESGCCQMMGPVFKRAEQAEQTEETSNRPSNRPSPNAGVNPCVMGNVPQEKTCFMQADLRAEYLHWTAFQTNLDYALRNRKSQCEVIDEDCTVLFDHARTKFLKYKYGGGFRLFGGFSGFRNKWSLMAGWTSFHRNAQASTEAKCDTEELFVTLMHPSRDLKRAAKAEGKLNLKYDVVDVLLSRSCTICDCLTLTPQLGMRILFLDQQMRVDYTGKDFKFDTFTELKPEYNPYCPCEVICDRRELFDGARVNFDSDYYGVGMLGGLDTAFPLGCGFHFQGTFIGAIVAGRNLYKHEELLSKCVDFCTKEPRPIIDVREKQYVAIPMLQIEGRLGWETKCYTKGQLRLVIGYSFTHLWNVPQLRRYHTGIESVSNSSHASTIGLHGGTFGAELLF